MKKMILILSFLYGFGMAKSNAQTTIRSIETAHFKVNETASGIEKGAQIFEIPYNHTIETFNTDGQLINRTQVDKSYSKLTKHTSTYSYDTRGFLIEKTVMKNGEIEQMNTFKYDSIGHLIFEQTMKNSIITNIDIFDYNKNGNQTRACYKTLQDHECDLNNCQRRIEYSYNNKGLKETCKDIDCDDIRTEKYEYNDIDSLIKITTIVNGKEFNFEAYEYDEMGNRIKKTVSDQEIHTYDTLGNRLTYKQFNDSGDLIVEERTNYTYKNDEKLEEWKQFNGEGEVLGQSLTLFDKHGNLTKYQSTIELDYMKIESSHIYEYQYDKEGNWINKIQFMDGKPLTLTERKIDYY